MNKVLRVNPKLHRRPEHAGVRCRIMGCLPRTLQALRASPSGLWRSGMLWMDGVPNQCALVLETELMGLLSFLLGLVQSFLVILLFLSFRMGMCALCHFRVEAHKSLCDFTGAWVSGDLDFSVQRVRTVVTHEFFLRMFCIVRWHKTLNNKGDRLEFKSGKGLCFKPVFPSKWCCFGNGWGVLANRRKSQDLSEPSTCADALCLLVHRMWRTFAKYSHHFPYLLHWR